jgi:hypothetical protein
MRARVPPLLPRVGFRSTPAGRAQRGRRTVLSQHFLAVSAPRPRSPGEGFDGLAEASLAGGHAAQEHGQQQCVQAGHLVEVRPEIDSRHVERAQVAEKHAVQVARRVPPDRPIPPWPPG